MFLCDVIELNAKCFIVDDFAQSQNLFDVPPGKLFWDVFNEEVAVFQYRIEDYTVKDIATMVKDPDARDAEMEMQIREEFRKVSKRTIIKRTTHVLVITRIILPTTRVVQSAADGR